MCGFAALFQADRIFAGDLLDAMHADLHHRGPDSGGVNTVAGHALVFRRLAIMDPGHGADQPMTDASGHYTLVFNGEIYNFKALRAELQASGAEFRTRGDTEVVLNGYAAWGESVLDRLEGMYAFVLLDRLERRVVAARDPLGIKPLYLLAKGGLVAFASEIRPLLRLTDARPDPAALAELLTFRFAAGRLSNILGIDRLPGGTVVKLDLGSGSVKERRFCDVLDTLRPDPSISAAEAESTAMSAVRESVCTHLQSDVGYAVQLSGGVDSSLIAALASGEADGSITTFGINLGASKFDESKWRTIVIDRYELDHHEVVITPGEFADALPRAVRHMEGPTPHSGCIMLMLLCDRIRHTAKVVLTGEGADEMFGGYKRYERWRAFRTKQWLARLVPSLLWPLLQRWREIQKYDGRDAPVYASVYEDVLALFDLFPDLIPAPGAREAASRRFRDFRDRMMACDQTAYLESLLMRQDRMAMAASVEARVPFAHLPLARAVNRLPRRIRVPGGATKPLLKRIAEPYLPLDLLHRRKVGLSLPLDEWLADPAGLGRYLELLTEPSCRLATYTAHGRLRHAVEAFRGGQRHGLPPLGHLVNVETWLRSLPPHENLS